ncbi:MAG: hypothetical protein U9P90_00550 [Patescibacteria group bacterium]|nr:hypothetical protein [Patescibacteria group bacterium]
MYSSFNIIKLLRFLGIIALAFLLASFIPGLPKDVNLSYFTSIPIASIFAIIIAFQINNAIGRMKKIETNVAIELSRCRRIHHLSKGFFGEPLLLWSKDIRKYVLVYLKVFKKFDFGSYHEANEAFRKISYHVYKLKPSALKSPKEVALYNELLITLREWAMVRQNLSELKKQKVSTYNWIILGAISAVLIGSLLMIRAETIYTTKLSASLSIVAVLFALDMLYELNNLNKRKRRKIARRYTNNISRLE